MDNASLPVVVALMAATLRQATPLILASLGGVFSERSGVVNIGLDGIMTCGAFFGVYGSYKTGSPAMGILFAIIAGMIVSSIHAFLSIHLKADQVVSGVAINLFSGALTSYLLLVLFNRQGQTDGVNALTYPKAFMRGIPVIGGFLSELNWYVFMAIILVFVTYFILYKTSLGLRIRAVGEHPKAADTLGVNVYAIRYLCVILSGALGGLAGASLSLGTTNLFREGMVSGRGFIALAAMIFGGWRPFGAMWASILFAFADAFQIVAQGFGWAIPYQFYSALPYILTMIALAGFVGKTTAPAADGVPYTKGER
ncbi:ABC transporter permease [Fonticella tunisiensis]|uniref:Nucleoside ABC transporter membrane protein n=1 Tax=Fonticella tunisiensis TaxID=1096341 RepID=A0A4R7KC54_9CLOT|nr:ABC transporter permease [Fonticella tunisiensis]TDT50742.1 nucleoside ABC transporter membrane protein [Fonticella tunisiensis]